MRQTINPTKIKDQIDMVYKYVGMKASVLMRSFINLGPLVLALENVRAQAKAFKVTYDTLQAQEQTNFSYLKLQGKWQDLNHGTYPDLYY